MIIDVRKNLASVLTNIKSTSMGLPSGIKELDDTILGFSPKEMITIAGRPGMGKSSLARDIMLSVGLPHLEKNILLCTLEMSCEEVVDLLIANLAKIDYYNYKKGLCTGDIKSLYDTACTQLSSYNIIISDDSYLTPESLRLLLEDLMKSTPIACVIVDYLQLMSLRCPVESRQTEVATISRELKAIAMDYDLSVIAMSQLNRNVEYRESTRPRMSDLRESGAMEQDSSKIILIHRPSYYDKTVNMDAADTGYAELIVVKNRKGPQRIVKCAWISEYMSFCDIPGISEGEI